MTEATGVMGVLGLSPEPHAERPSVADQSAAYASVQWDLATRHIGMEHSVVMIGLRPAALEIQVLTSTHAI
jgi:hypothetical protein